MVYSSYKKLLYLPFKVVPKMIGIAEVAIKKYEICSPLILSGTVSNLNVL